MQWQLVESLLNSLIFLISLMAAVKVKIAKFILLLKCQVVLKRVTREGFVHRLTAVHLTITRFRSEVLNTCRFIRKHYHILR